MKDGPFTLLLVATVLYTALGMLVYFGWNTFLVSVFDARSLSFVSSLGVAALVWASNIALTSFVESIARPFARRE